MAQELTQPLELRHCHSFLNSLELGDGAIGRIGSPGFIMRLGVFQWPSTTFLISPNFIPIYKETADSIQFWSHRAVQEFGQLLSLFQTQILWPSQHKKSVFSQGLTHMSHFIPTCPGSRWWRKIIFFLCRDSLALRERWRFLFQPGFDGNAVDTHLSSNSRIRKESG
jgi:hypothetical protein